MATRDALARDSAMLRAHHIISASHRAASTHCDARCTLLYHSARRAARGIAHRITRHSPSRRVRALCGLRRLLLRQCQQGNGIGLEQNKGGSTLTRLGRRCARAGTRAAGVMAMGSGIAGDLEWAQAYGRGLARYLLPLFMAAPRKSRHKYLRDTRNIRLSLEGCVRATPLRVAYGGNMLYAHCTHSRSALCTDASYGARISRSLCCDTIAHAGR